MPLLGWKSPTIRNQAEQDAHELAKSKMMRMTLAPQDLATGEKIILTDFWNKADVIADVGLTFTGFHQLTGSCVGASAGNAVFTLAAIQRLIAENPTIAFLPWWPYDYGRTRYKEGDRGQGEGAIDSVMGTVLAEGVLPMQSGLPAFETDDGFYLTSKLELQWSDGRRIDSKYTELAKAFPVGGVAPVETPEQIATGIINGYPCLNGCDNYVGHGSITGSGDTAYVKGHYDGRGGHSTCVLGYWKHPNDGPLFLYSNQWPTSTYPRDPAGAGRCCVWITESEMAKLFRNSGDNGESMLLSHLNYLPAQPALLDWYL